MPVVQDSQLKEAGIKAGISIWRVEVSFFILYIIEIMTLYYIIY